VARLEYAGFEALFEQCDLWIREGQTALARGKLKKINIRKIPRNNVVRFCTLARRAQLWDVSLRAMKPIVRPKAGGSNATPDEKIEYALSLWRVGAHKEAEGLLSDPKVAGNPRVGLAQAHGMMQRWDYESALMALDKFISSSGVTEYERCVGQVNRLACLAFLGREEFTAAHAGLDRQLDQGKLNLLRANASEIQAQNFIHRGQLDKAGRALDIARELIGQEKGRSTFLIGKWQAILNGLAEKSTGPLNAFRQTALANKSWEVLRDIDYFYDLIDPASGWGDFCYYGTPYKGFRDKLRARREFPAEKWLVAGLGQGEGKEFDPWYPKQGDAEIPHRFVLLLLRDFYRPVTLGEAFQLIHSDQYFDIDIATGRIRQLVHRTRKWIKENGLPFRIEEQNGAYSLRITRGTKLLCRDHMLPLQKEAFAFARLSLSHSGLKSTAEWARIMGKPHEQARRWLVNGLAEGLLDRHGQGQFITYRIKESCARSILRP